ncbi:MAG: flagellar biosynthetic protein FliO [Rhodanobacter sp.]
MLALWAYAPSPSMPDINVGGELVRVVLSLAGIVVLIFAAGWLSRRMQARQIGGGRRLRCLEAMPVSSRERVLLLEADGKRLLIGVGAGGVRTLHVYDGQAPEGEVERPAAPNFSELLGRWRRNP